MKAHPLQLLAAPLSDTTLIEASAGTGKTYSISWLYLRFLLERGLHVKQILVVTFTNAAADELRSRIRARLVWARNCLASLPVVDVASVWSEQEANTESAASEESNLLAGIVKNCAGVGIDREQIELALQLAVQSFDEAAIHTIHIYCRKVLSEFALDCSVPLSLNEPASDVAMCERFVEDFWRRGIHSSDLRRGMWLLRLFNEPKTLAEATRDLLNLPAQALDPCDPSHELQIIESALEHVCSQTRALWSNEPGAYIEAVLSDKQYGMSRSKEKGTDSMSVAMLCSELDAYFSRRDPLVPLPKGIAIFRRELLEKNQNDSARSKGKPLPDNPLFNSLGKLSEHADAFARMRRAVLLLEATVYVREKLRLHEEESAVLGFDGLIRRVHEAVSGNGGSRLAVNLRERYPVALVDEFQDTDQRQYAIFRHIYAKHGSLLMIGDAKQAIYAFRGADVFAYALARGDAADQVFTLDTNYRSEPALSNALNRLFGGNDTFIVDFIDWRDVRGGGPKQGHRLQPLSPPLTLWHVSLTPDICNQREKKRAIAGIEKLEIKITESVASEILHLLQTSAAGDLHFDLPGETPPQRAIRAGDIAVLVVSHKQALHIEVALRRRGIAVSRRARESVFASAEAHELTLLLRALLEPARLPSLRAAMATLLFGFNTAQLETLNTQEGAWEKHLTQFAELAAHWRNHGVLSVLLEVLREAAPRLLPLVDGERRVANYLQLAELLDSASVQCADPRDLLLWLERNRDTPDTANTEQLLRLDSDAQAVQVVTIHASKGLEYPIVFAPFLWKAPNKKNASKVPVISHDADHQVVADLGTPRLAQRIAQHELETDAESMRLAYVACTRAINHLYLAWGTTESGSSSPLWRLLNKPANEQRIADETFDDDLVATRLAAFGAVCEGAATVCGLPESLQGRLSTVPDYNELEARPFTRSLYDARRVLSFTRLVEGLYEEHAADHDALAQSHDTFDVSQIVSTQLRGAGFGECLHQILERADFQSSDVQALSNLVAEQVRSAGFAPNIEANFLSLVCATLDAEILPRLRLRTLPAGRRIAEMEFHFRLRGGAAVALDNLMQRFPDYADALGLLHAQGQHLHGLMNGFIDLTLEHEGRFYVLDYKSNWLGSQAYDYRCEALARAMTQHHYDLQALIYQVALYRYLRLRLGGRYSHTLLGGALYLFVRGLDTTRTGAGVVHEQVPAELVETLDLWLDTR